MEHGRDPQDGRPDLVAEINAVLARRDGPGAPETADELIAEFRLAQRVREAVGDDPERVDALDLELTSPLADWILQLPFDLADAGLVEEAVAIGREFAPLFRAETLLGDRAEILATSGRHDEARAQAEENLAQFPHSVWTIVKAGYAFEECGDTDRAEALYRNGLQLAGDDAYAALLALDQLVPLLEQTGRAAEAAQLASAGERFQDALAESEEQRPVPGLELFGADAEVEGEAGAAIGPESRDFTALARQLFTFSAREEFGAAHARAISLWFGERSTATTLDEMIRTTDDEWAASAFLEWMMFDFRFENGRTLLEQFVERRAAKLDDTGRRLLERLARSHLGAYEILEVEEGRGFTARDVPGGVRFAVRAPEESEWLMPGDFFAARMIDLDGALQLTGAVIPLDTGRRGELVAALEATRGAAAGRGFDEVLKANGPLFMAFSS